MSEVFEVKAATHYDLVTDPNASGYFLVVVKETNESLCQCEKMMIGADIVRALEVAWRQKEMRMLGF